MVDEADDASQVYTLMYSSGTTGAVSAKQCISTSARAFGAAATAAFRCTRCWHCIASHRDVSSMRLVRSVDLVAGGAPKAVATPKSTWRKTNCTPGPLSAISFLEDRRTVSYLSMSHGADRGIIWFTTIAGGRTGLITGPAGSDEFFAAMRELRPTFFLGFSCFWQDLFHRHAQRVRSAVSSALQPRLGSATLSAVQSAQLEAAFLRTRRGQAVERRVAALAREELGGALTIAATGLHGTGLSSSGWLRRPLASRPTLAVAACDGAADCVCRRLAYASGGQVFHSPLHDRWERRARDRQLWQHRVSWHRLERRGTTLSRASGKPLEPSNHFYHF